MNSTLINYHQSVNLLTFQKDGIEKTTIKVHPSTKDFQSYRAAAKQSKFEYELDHLYSHWEDIDSVYDFTTSRYYSDDLLIDYNPQSNSSFEQVVWEVRKRMWSLRVTRNLLDNLFDFSLRVAVGLDDKGKIYYSEHPVAIQDFISERFSPEMYELWSELIWDDIASFEDVVNFSRNKISSVIPSVVSHYRSEMLLDLVDIPVEYGIAFLIPTKLGG